MPLLVAYHIGMSYEVGTYIDLTHLNRQTAQAAQANSKWNRGLLSVGTHFDFTKDLKPVLHIPVAFAS